MTRLFFLVVLAPMVASAPLLAGGLQAKASAEPVLAAAREALGGADVLAGVRALSATGEHRRIVGEREMSGDLTVELLFPDKVRRREEMGMPGRPGISRTTVLNGDESWTESSGRGGAMMRFGGRGGDGTPGRQMSDEDRARMQEMQAQRLRQEMARLQFAWLIRADGPIAYVATAEAADGSADVLEIGTADGRPVRLFLDRATHRPLMLTYEAPVPRMRFAGRGGPRPTPEAIERMRREPPQIATFEMRFDEYRRVDGILLPHVITWSIDGDAVEEWTIEEFKVNPELEPGTFQRKGRSN